jgi:hypothetical protein
MYTIVEQNEKRPRDLMAFGFVSLKPSMGSSLMGPHRIVHALNLDRLWENDLWGQDEAKFHQMARDLKKPYNYCETPITVPLPEYRHILQLRDYSFLASFRDPLIGLIRGLHIQQLMRKKVSLMGTVLPRDGYDQRIYDHPIVEELLQELGATLVWWP